MEVHGYLVGSVLFLVGCIAFVIDALVQKNLTYLIGSALFTIGTIFYIIDAVHVETEQTASFFRLFG